MKMLKCGWEINMINITKMNNVNITINDDLIESIEETPDTVITLTTGKKLIVKESREEIIELVKKYKKELYRLEN
jgi:flagellar protein FlbD